MRVLITGANGFVGEHIRRRLVADGHDVAGTIRDKEEHGQDRSDNFVCDVCSDAGWGDAMRDRDVVIHLAARVHQMNDAASDPLVEYRRVNCQGSLRVMHAARSAGVGRMIFMSTIKVLGSRTEAGKPFHANSPLMPDDPYGRSKAEAEDALMAEMGVAGSPQVVVIRPSLVYGHGVKGNLQSLRRWLAKGLPLPFGAIENRRTMLGVDNLCDLVVTVMGDQRAVGLRLLAADTESVTTPQLIRALALVSGRHARLLSIPPPILALTFRMLGRRRAWDRLAGSLEVDISGTCRELDWTPPFSFEEGMKRAFASDE